MTAIVAMTNRDMYRAAVISQMVENDFMTGLQVAKHCITPLCPSALMGIKILLKDVEY